MSWKALEIQTKCAHAHWASYNTPQMELIQYGQRIGKKVYWRARFNPKVYVCMHLWPLAIGRRFANIDCKIK